MINPGYRKFGLASYSVGFVRQVNIDDVIMYVIEGSSRSGRVSAITRRGVNINSGYGDVFVKWDNVYMLVKRDA